jgi:ferredoxin
VTGDEILSINDFVKAGCKEKIQSEKPFVFVCPTYAWRMPRVVEKFIRDVQFEGSKKTYFILTCGDGTGNAAYYAKTLCHEKGFAYMGLASVIMPENYIALYNAPDKAEADAIIEKATPEIYTIAGAIKEEHVLEDKPSNLRGKFSSAFINLIFYPCFVSAKGFHATDACIQCGKCMSLCPLNNVKLVNGKPQWGNDCTHCMACICSCPRKAIEYKRKTQGKPRYYNHGFQKV